MWKKLKIKLAEWYRKLFGFDWEVVSVSEFLEEPCPFGSDAEYIFFPSAYPYCELCGGAHASNDTGHLIRSILKDSVGLKETSVELKELGKRMESLEKGLFQVRDLVKRQGEPRL